MKIRAVAGNTFTELIRQKVFYFLFIFALLLIGSSVFLARFSFQQEFQILKDVALGAMSIFSSLLAILAGARLIPQDIEDRTIYTILAKPVARFEYLLGKLLGVLALLAVSVLLMSALFLAVLYAREQTLLNETARQFVNGPHQQLEDALRNVRASAISASLFLGIVAIYVKASVLAALTIFISTFATTNIFTVVVMVFVYLIGHLQATAREFWLAEHTSGLVTRVFLAAVTLIFPDLQAFNFVDDVVAGAAIPLGIFSKTVALGAFYVIVYTLLATIAFYGKEL